MTLEKESCFEQLVTNKETSLFGEPTACVEATEPTNFIFENQDEKIHHRVWKIVLIVIVILILLSSVIAISLFLKR